MRDVARVEGTKRMENVTLREAGSAINADSGELPGVPVAGVSIDSRTVGAGDLFFAIPGERYDGHEFVDAALDGGAVAAVVSNDASMYPGEPGAKDAPGGLLLQVPDTIAALQELAAWYRGRFDVRVVAVTGTNGKTTTKDMAAAVLSAEMPTARTEGNLNNHIGVPLTLLELSSDDRAAVVEMGMNHPGEIRRLAEIARPHVGVITNVGEAHLETMGTLEAVAEAKGELLDALPPDGAAVLNADDPRIMAQAGRSAAKVTTYGLTEDAELRGARINERFGPGVAAVEFEIDGDGKVELPVPGRHNVSNALAALAVGDVMGVDREAGIRALSTFRSSPMRMRMTTAGRWTVLNDAYNSNPASLAVALETLAGIADTRPSVAVLGDMLELGARSPEAHRDAGRKLAELGVGHALLYGNKVSHMREGAIEGGMPPANINVYESKDALARELEELPVRDAVVLVKGSRDMRMEEVVELLVKEAPAS
ncbi:MAG: UDP-N-acetylmuramoyl-tripeptide--D-alanyl-D-alanine ligase [Candidatus Eisenbacteria bacterium]|nr:UDP-N-acetylmuramoyl-tripeptide--D-alanyl-D-alanine ligase [Candidatus Eisenbacteria bacterium]